MGLKPHAGYIGRRYATLKTRERKLI